MATLFERTRRSFLRHVQHTCRLVRRQFRAGTAAATESSDLSRFLCTVFDTCWSNVESTDGCGTKRLIRVGLLSETSIADNVKQAHCRDGYEVRTELLDKLLSDSDVTDCAQTAQRRGGSGDSSACQLIQKTVATAGTPAPQMQRVLKSVPTLRRPANSAALRKVGRLLIYTKAMLWCAYVLMYWCAGVQPGLQFELALVEHDAFFTGDTLL